MNLFPFFTNNRPPGSPSIWQQLKGLNRSQRNAFIASYLGWMLDAFDFFILIVVIRHIAADFHTDVKALTYAIFLTLAMRPVGALIFGMLADRYGRRPTLMFNVAFFSVMELLSGFAPSLTWLLILRALYGIGMGGEWGVGASLVMESVPKETRGILSGILQQGYPVGSLFAAAAYIFAFPYIGWRGMFFLGFLPAILALYIRRNVEESPAWEKNREVIKHAGTDFMHAFLNSFKHNWKIFVYMVFLMTLFNFFSHGTQDLYPSAFLEGQRGISPRTTGTINIIYNIGALLGGIIFGAYSQFVGRRRAIIVASLMAIPIIPLWIYSPTTGMLAIGAFFIQFVVQGAWGVVPVYLNELSPVTVRGTFPGLAYQLGNLLAACNATLQAELAIRWDGDYGRAMAWIVGTVAVLLAVAAYFGPESANATLDAGDSPKDIMASEEPVSV